MERTAPALTRVQPSPRAARKSEWLRSALAHHHCPDTGAENEIVVLATGIDQYLQEVFHHLAYPNRDDTVSAEDFTALCAVLGLARVEKGKMMVIEKEVEGDGDKDDEDAEFLDVCSGLPSQLSFKDFHSRLCGYFRVRSARGGTGECAWRLPVSGDTELVERQIRLRWPRVRRRKCVSFDLTRHQTGAVNRSMKSCTSKDREPDEVEALRELVEDLRSALQGSDARCLALEVALRRERSSIAPSPSRYNSPVSSITLIQGKLVPTRRIKGTRGGSVGVAGSRAVRRRDIRDPLLRELRLIRSSRDGQLEEAMKFNERLEEELQWAYQEVRKLQGVESALRKENAQIRRRAEEAREALSLGLQRVRLIQEQAQCVPQLQTTITQLESELQQYRSRCICVPDLSGQHIHPEDTCDKTECLQRAVEGRAASDEEEEDRGAREDGECCLTEGKRHVGRLHGCGRGCQDNVVHHTLSKSRLQDKNLSSTPKDSRGCCSCKGLHQEESRGFEKNPVNDGARTKQQDKEKTHLSLLEDKLSDSLSLLLQLRNQNVSRRVLKKIVMDTVDVCGRNGDGMSDLHLTQVLKVADTLCVRLSSSDLHTGGENGGGGGQSGDKLMLSSGRQTSSINPLLISC
ncbi:EF-hand and coiled-coil domain-containing protein 1 [Parambassis ranga]|uniref:EF-hand and coiled-coil domain-containing protein 1 n=1 Tax=Parambassis ranga TaxID=210632 RepID=A0A6P7IBA5_9TELE|nr:EF-hand and coiled-coil domain-containing protein 1-like [Parambassis ranga]